ncbi:hypothetical protein [Thaumasiovibrio sp. DFM-14]|uniref:hypothetical protein n=1 Tax=Thaumasiovibrio sp. DFM-14 TaxID=3384792 RepID=UPI00399F21AC
MNTYIQKLPNRLALSAIVCTIGYLSFASANARAEAYTFNPIEKACMADAYLLEPGNSLPKDALNCTANDVEITQVIPTDPNAECVLGTTFSFEADVTVRTNANERYDTTFYLPLTEQSPQVVQGVGSKNCSLILPVPGGSGEVADVDLDGDECGDISKASGVDEYTLQNETITMLCSDEDGDSRADFVYCAAWDNIERNNCTVSEDPFSGQIPNTKSKCNCDTFNIDVFIKPPAPAITKALVGTDTYSEPGGEFTFDISFTNGSSVSSLFLTSLTDEIDIDGDGTYDHTVDLWGTPAPAGSADGIYLTATNCLSGSPYEIAPSATYSCQIKVHIVDSDLPNVPAPAIYDDVIKAVLEDKNGTDIGDGSTCPSGLGAGNGDNCSSVKRVTITNLPPTVSVDKTADKSEVLEPGENVEFTVTVTNTSGSFDSPVTLTSLTDTIYGDILGNCLKTTLAKDESTTCTFTEFVAGDQGESELNEATAIVTDNENDTGTDSDTHLVNILDVPSMIELVKTASPETVEETGDDPSLFRQVDYTFTFSVKLGGGFGVDDVTFTQLDDTIFGDITNECNVTSKNGAPHASTPLTNGFVLQPGEWASCVITKGLQGDFEDVHTNVATIYGTDDDGIPLTASNDATVTFTNVPPTSTLAFALSGLVVIEITNTGIENVTLDTLTLAGINVADGAGNTQFTILNTLGGDYDGVSYDACNLGEVIGYSGSATDTYACAFTVELKPGLENTDAVNFLATSTEAVTVGVADNDGNSADNDVEVTVITAE